MKTALLLAVKIRISAPPKHKIARHWKTEQSGIVAIDRLREMTIRFGLSLAMGELTYLDGVCMLPIPAC